MVCFRLVYNCKVVLGLVYEVGLEVGMAVCMSSKTALGLLSTWFGVDVRQV